jgi:hypothetical protein
MATSPTEELIEALLVVATIGHDREAGPESQWSSAMTEVTE